MPSRPAGDPALKTYARVKLRRDVKALAMATGRGCELPRCLLPTRAINWDAPSGGPHPAPDSYVLDERTARIHGGRADDLTNVRPAHHRCNSSAGQALGQARRRTTTPITVQPAATEGRW